MICREPFFQLRGWKQIERPPMSSIFHKNGDYLSMYYYYQSIDHHNKRTLRYMLNIAQHVWRHRKMSSDPCPWKIDLVSYTQHLYNKFEKNFIFVWKVYELKEFWKTNIHYASILSGGFSPEFFFFLLV